MPGGVAKKSKEKVANNHQKATGCSLGKAQLGLLNEPWNSEQTNSESAVEANTGQQRGDH